MLNQRNKSNRCNGQNRIRPKNRQAQHLIHNILIQERKRMSLPHRRHINEPHRHAHQISHHNGKENRHQIINPLRKYGNTNHRSQNRKGHQNRLHAELPLPVKSRADSRARKPQSNHNNNRPRHNRRQQPIHLLIPHKLNQRRKHRIHQPRHNQSTLHRSQPLQIIRIPHPGIPQNGTNPPNKSKT